MKDNICRKCKDTIPPKEETGYNSTSGLCLWCHHDALGNKCSVCGGKIPEWFTVISENRFLCWKCVGKEILGLKRRKNDKKE